MTSTAAKAVAIAALHVRANVTGLVQELVNHECDVGNEMMFGDPETPTPAYDAAEVWAVSTWLGNELTKRGERVFRFEDQNYWARRRGKLATHFDDVIVAIAEAIPPAEGQLS